MSEEEKQELFKEHKGLSIYYDTYVNVKEYYKLHQENKQLKSVIEEIFNYLEDNNSYSLEKGIINNTDITKLYEILDKANIKEVNN